MNLYELKPSGNVKSFYGKAKILEEDGTKTLFSYGTPIMRLKDGYYERLWDGWSVTTGRHIKAFSGMNKREYLDLPLKH